MQETIDQNDLIEEQIEILEEQDLMKMLLTKEEFYKQSIIDNKIYGCSNE
jgi:hypothetical protein